MIINKIKLASSIVGLLFVMDTSIVYAKKADKIEDKPNIIFIFADDLGWGDISKHGHPDIRTPNIDRLAEEGSEFYQFSVSNPVCSPSRAAVMTGQYPARNSVHRHFATPEHHDNFSMPDWLDKNVVTMPRILQQAGYKTAHFGKWHLTNRNIKDAPLPTEYGYDEAAQRIGKILNLLDELGLTENTLVVFSSDNGPEITGPKANYFHPNDPDGKVEGMDPLGTYFSVGQTAGLRGQKRDTYEGGLRVPFLVRWPGKVPVGRVDTQSVITAVDLLPTFADIAGAPLPQNYQSDGQSILELLEGGTLTREKPMFWQWRYGKKSRKKPMIAVREGPWKLFFYQDKNRIELYNVMRDRAESMNVASQYPTIVNKLKNLGLEWSETLPLSPKASAISKQR